MFRSRSMLAVIILLLLCGWNRAVYAASDYTDLIPKSYVNKSITPVAQSGSGSITGSIGDISDNSNSSYYEWEIYHGWDGTAEGYVTFDATWAKPKRIERVYVHYQHGNFGGNYKQARGTYRTQLKINGNWTTIDEFSFDRGGWGSNYLAWETYEKTLTGGWNNVTGLRSYLYGNAYSYEGDRYQYVILRINAVRVYRQRYMEILRARKGAETIPIGGLNLNGHKLRVRKGGTTYGIPLLDVDDPESSPLRIYDGSSIKALPRAD